MEMEIDTVIETETVIEIEITTETEMMTEMEIETDRDTGGGDRERCCYRCRWRLDAQRQTENTHKFGFKRVR